LSSSGSGSYLATRIPSTSPAVPLSQRGISTSTQQVGIDFRWEGCLPPFGTVPLCLSDRCSGPYFLSWGSGSDAGCDT
jgi:hypothetical protein